MRKFTNGKFYTTEISELIGKTIPTKAGRFAFQNSLYRDKDGEFFLHTEQITPDGTVTMENILPYTVEEAKAYCKQYLPTKTYKKIFG